MSTNGVIGQPGPRLHVLPGLSLLSRFPRLPRRGRAGAASARSRLSGGGLIEVLVCMALLAVGVLSMSWLQAAAIRHDKLSQFRGTAIHLAGGLADRMRANATGASGYARLQTYAPATVSTSGKDCLAVSCTAPELAAYDLATMRNLARTLLPGGDLQVEVPPTGVATIWLLWLDPAVSVAEDDAASLARRCPEAIGMPDPMPQCLPIRVLL